MNPNTRFAILVAVVVLVVGALWFAIRGGDRTPEPTAPSDTKPEAAVTQAPEVAGAPEPHTPGGRFTPSAQTAAAGPREPRKAARTGAAAVRGLVVLESDNTPVEGAEVALYWIDNERAVRVFDEGAKWTATTNARGFFRVDKLPSGSMAVFARKDDLGGMSGASINPRETEDHVVQIALQPIGTISGTVVNEQRQPVGDAIVALERGKDGARDMYGGYRQTKSHHDGSFMLEFVPKGQWRLEARAEGYAVGQAEHVAADSNDVQIILKKGATVSGTVVSSESSKPVSNVAIRLLPSGGSRLNNHEITGGADGSFEFIDLADGTYHIGLYDQPYITSGEVPPITISNAESVRDLKIPVMLGGSVTGRATDAETGAPIVGMAFRAMSRGGGGGSRYQAETDEEGIYRIEGLPSGQYLIRRLWMAGYRHGENREDKSVTVTVGQEVSGIDFAVPPGLYLRGRVVDKNGDPIPQVEVQSVDTEGKDEGDSMVTDEKGRFVHRGFSPNTRVTIIAVKAGYSAPPLENVLIGDTDRNDIEIVMDTSGSIAGVITDKSGKPMPDLYITAMPVNENQVPPQNGYTREEGTFKIQGLAEGTYRLSVRPPRSWREMEPVGNEIRVDKGENVTGVKLVVDFDTGAKVAGRVVNSAGRPVADANVSVHSRTGQSGGYAQTDADGAFEIVGLSEGEHILGVHHQNYSQYRDDATMVPNANIKITLRGKATIEGRILDARNGQPVKSFEILSIPGQVRMSPGDVWGRGQSYFHENGEFSIHVDDGEATLYVTAKGYAPLTHMTSNNREDQTTSGVILRLESGAIVDGVVSDKQGRPVAGATIFSGRMPQEWERNQRPAAATTDETGAFRIDSLAPGELRLYAIHPDYAIGTATATPVSGGAATVRIVMGSGGQIKGTVRLGGRPVAGGYGISVFFPNLEGGFQSNVTVGSTGEYTLSGLPEGEAMLHLYGQSNTTSRRSLQKRVDVVADNVVTVDFDIVEGNAAVEGTVSRDGQPAACFIGVTIRGNEDNIDSVSAETDARGVFKLTGLPPGQANLMVHLRDTNQARAFSVQLESGQTTRMDIELSAGSRVTGRVNGVPQDWFGSVVLIRGNVTPPENLQALYQEFQTLVAGATQLAGDGSYQIEGIEPGDYTIVAVAMDPRSGGQTMKHTFQPVTVTEDGEVSVNLTLP